MHRPLRRTALFLLLCLLSLTPAPLAGAQPHQKHHAQQHDDKAGNDKPLAAAELQHPTLWREPQSISSLDLYWGQGGKDHQPAPPFTFEQEDLHGTNPKFDARDANQVKWRVKLGAEARPEVVASRLLWAAGYFVNDDYVLESADIANLHLHRGARLAKGGHIRNARFARKPEDEKKIGIWRWRNNPLAGTREFDGLRVMMALLNNWDVKDENNAVYRDKESGQDLLLVSDVGATFGTNGISWTLNGSKGSLNAYRKSKFILRTNATTVDFATPKPPTAVLIKSLGFAAPRYFQRRRLDWVGRRIPREHARWIGSILAQLSHQQIVDAFRAGHFPPEESEQFAQIVEARIRALQQL